MSYIRYCCFLENGPLVKAVKRLTDDYLPSAASPKFNAGLCSTCCFRQKSSHCKSRRNFRRLKILKSWVIRGSLELQELEFAAAEKGFTAVKVKHQREVGTGYFDAVTQVIQQGQSSTTALHGSTEDEQCFDAKKVA